MSSTDGEDNLLRCRGERSGKYIRLRGVRVSIEQEISLNTATEVTNSHKALSAREDNIFLGWVVDRCYDILRHSPNINALDVASGLRGPTHEM